MSKSISDLIDLSKSPLSPQRGNLLDPLIRSNVQTSKSIREPRMSLDNNPFDKALRQVDINKSKATDPFEMVFNKAVSQNVNTNRQKENVIKEESDDVFVEEDQSTENLTNFKMTVDPVRFSSVGHWNSPERFNGLAGSPQCIQDITASELLSVSKFNESDFDASRNGEIQEEYHKDKYTISESDTSEKIKEIVARRVSSISDAMFNKKIVNKNLLGTRQRSFSSSGIQSVNQIRSSRVPSFSRGNNQVPLNDGFLGSDSQVSTVSSIQFSRLGSTGSSYLNDGFIESTKGSITSDLSITPAPTTSYGTFDNAFINSSTNSNNGMFIQLKDNKFCYVSPINSRSSTANNYLFNRRCRSAQRAVRNPRSPVCTNSFDIFNDKFSKHCSFTKGSSDQPGKCLKSFAARMGSCNSLSNNSDDSSMSSGLNGSVFAEANVLADTFSKLADNSYRISENPSADESFEDLMSINIQMNQSFSDDSFYQLTKAEKSMQNTNVNEEINDFADIFNKMTVVDTEQYSSTVKGLKEYESNDRLNEVEPVSKTTSSDCTHSQLCNVKEEHSEVAKITPPGVSVQDKVAELLSLLKETDEISNDDKESATHLLQSFTNMLIDKKSGSNSPNKEQLINVNDVLPTPQKVIRQDTFDIEKPFVLNNCCVADDIDSQSGNVLPAVFNNAENAIDITELLVELNKLPFEEEGKHTLAGIIVNSLEKTILNLQQNGNLVNEEEDSLEDKSSVRTTRSKSVSISNKSKAITPNKNSKSNNPRTSRSFSVGNKSMFKQNLIENKTATRKSVLNKSGNSSLVHFSPSRSPSRSSVKSNLYRSPIFGSNLDSSMRTPPCNVSAAKSNPSTGSTPSKSSGRNKSASSADKAKLSVNFKGHKDSAIKLADKLKFTQIGTKKHNAKADVIRKQKGPLKALLPISDMVSRPISKSGSPCFKSMAPFGSKLPKSSTPCDKPNTNVKPMASSTPDPNNTSHILSLLSPMVKIRTESTSSTGCRLNQTLSPPKRTSTPYDLKKTEEKTPLPGLQRGNSHSRGFNFPGSKLALLRGSSDPVISLKKSHK